MPWHTGGPAAAAGYLTAVDVEETAAEGLEGEGGADGEGVVKKKRNRRRSKRGIKKEDKKEDKKAAAAVDRLLQSEFEFFDGDVQVDDQVVNLYVKTREADRLEALLREAKASIDEHSVIRVKKAGGLSEVEGGPAARRVTPKPAEEESPKSGKEATPDPAPAAEPTESAPEAVEDAGDDPKHGGEADDEEDGDAVEEDEESDGPPPLMKKTRRGWRSQAPMGLDAQEEDEEEEEEQKRPKRRKRQKRQKSHYGASCELRHPEKKVLEICRHFYNGLVHPGSRGCTFGNQCRYLHDFRSFAAHLVARP